MRSSGYGKGKKGGNEPPRHRFTKHVVEQACAEIIKEEREKGVLSLNVGSITALLISHFKVSELTELGCRGPWQIAPLDELARLQSSVMLLINTYRSHFSFGSLHECLEYVTRQAADLKLTSGPITRFEDIGLGPYRLHPELQKHFPGMADIPDSKMPPRVTFYEIFEVFVSIIRDRTRGLGRLTPQMITDLLERKRGATIKELCVYVKDVNMGRMISLVGPGVRQYDAEVKQAQAQYLSRKHHELRARQMGVTQEDIDQFDAEVKRTMRQGQDIYDGLLHKLTMWVSTGEGASIIHRRMVCYLDVLKRKREVPLTDALIISLMKFIEVYKECPVCKTSMDSCAACTKTLRERTGTHKVTAQLETGTVAEDELLNAVKDCINSKVQGRKAQEILHSLEEDSRAVFDVQSFDSLGHGSFLEFFVHNTVELEEAGLAFSSSNNELSTDTKPSPKDIVDQMLKLLSARSLFHRTWTILNNLEVETPKGLGHERWSDICNYPFTHFMKLNSRVFTENGYEFLHSSDTAPPVVDMALAATFITKTEAVTDSSEVAERLLQEHYGVRKIEDLHLGNKECVLKGVDQTRTLVKVLHYPGHCELDVAGEDGSGWVATDAAAEAQAMASVFEEEPLELLLEAAEDPSGEDLRSVMLWDELYAEQHGPLEEFIGKNSERLAEKGVKILECTEGFPKKTKFYAVARGGDFSSIESACTKRDYWGLGVQLWSYIVLEGLSAIESDDRSNMESLWDPIREALQAAASAYNLPKAVAELLLAIPTGVVKVVFETAVVSVLEKIDPKWDERCAGHAASHPMRSELLKRAVKLNLKSWVEAGRRAVTEYPVFQKTAIVREVVEVAKPVPEAVAEKTTVARGKPNDTAAQEKGKEGAGNVQMSSEEEVIANIRAGLCEGEDSNVTKILQRTLTVISEQLYESKFHFFFELIQNADDNTYFPDTVPSLRLTLRPDGIEVLNNECGFVENNVRAVCNVNLSTKAGKSASIGRKGIGFKAVFSVSDEPHIISNGYNFYFDRTSCDLGLILPQEGSWRDPSNGSLIKPKPDTQKLCEGEWVTQLHLPFKESLQNQGFYEECTTGANDVQLIVLLFLNKLRRVEVLNEIRGVSRTLSRLDEAAAEEGRDTDDDDEGNTSSTKVVRLLETVGDEGQGRDKVFVVHKKNVAVPEGVKSPGGSQDTCIQVAFLKPEAACDIQVFPVTAFLPTNARVFKFVLQADWTVNAARDRIVESDQWNNWLREAALGVILSAMQGVRDMATRGELPSEYLLAVLPDRELLRGDWFRPLSNQLCKELRNKDIMLTRTGEWAEPKRCVLLPEGMEEEILELFEAEALFRAKGLHYVGDAQSSNTYRPTSALLGVKEVDASLLVSLLEKLFTNETTAFSAEEEEEEAGLRFLSSKWVGKYLLCLRSLLRSIAGSSQEQGLLERVGKVAMVPVTGGKMLAPGIHKILLPVSQPAAFMEMLHVVDKAFVDGCKDAVGLRAMLGKLGVKPTQDEQVLKCISTDIANKWEENEMLLPMHVISAVTWISDRFGRKTESDEDVRSLLASMPVVCSANVPSPLNEGCRELRDPQTQEAFLLVSAVDQLVLHEKAMINPAKTFGLQWLHVHGLYSATVRDKSKLLNTLGVMGVRESIVGAYYSTDVSVDADSEWAQHARELGVELPDSADGKYRLKKDCTWPGVERVVQGFADIKNKKVLQERWLTLAQMLCSGETEWKSQLTTPLSYITDWSKLKGFDGKVASEKDRREHTDRVPTSLALMLTRTKWVLATDGNPHTPRTTYQCNASTIGFLGNHANYYTSAIPTTDIRRTQVFESLLLQLGVKDAVSDDALVEHLESWYEQQEFTACIKQMRGIVEHLGGRVKYIWMPLERKPYQGMDSEDLKGAWYPPETCYVKAGQGGFLDRAKTKYRYVGFVYMRCGHQLGEIGVTEYAPWEVQVEGLESIARNNIPVSPDDVLKLLQDFDNLQDEITEEGWQALKTSKIWWTQDLEFASSGGGTLLYDDMHISTDRLPDGHHVLSERIHLTEKFMERCGMRGLSTVVKKKTRAEEVPFSPSAYVYYTYAWRVMCQKAYMLCKEHMEAAAFEKLSQARAFEDKNLRCKLVGSLTVKYEVQGAAISVENNASNAGNAVHLDDMERTLFVLVKNTSSQILTAMLKTIVALIREEAADGVPDVVAKGVAAFRGNLAQIPSTGRFSEVVAQLSALEKQEGEVTDGWYEARSASDFTMTVQDVEKLDEGGEKNEVFGWVAAKIAEVAADKDLLNAYTLAPMRSGVEVKYREKGVVFFTDVRMSLLQEDTREALYAMPDSADDLKNITIGFAKELGNVDEVALKDALENGLKVALPTTLPVALLEGNKVLRGVNEDAELLHEDEVPTVVREVFDAEEEERKQSKIKRNENTAKAAAAADKEKEKPKERVRESADPSMAVPTFGGGRSGHSTGIVPNKEALERANLSKQNWPSFQVPENMHFVGSEKFIGDKEGFEFKSGKSGLGYYRTGVEEDEDEPTNTVREYDDRSDEGTSGDDDEQICLSMPGGEKLDGAFKSGGAGPASRGTEVSAPTSHTADTGAMKEKALGKWGEGIALDYLRKNNPADVFFSTNSHGESFAPFDIVSGITEEEFAIVSRNHTYEEVLAKHPDFQVFEVKATKHEATFFELSWNEYDAATSLAERYTILHITDAMNAPKIVKVHGEG